MTEMLDHSKREFKLYKETNEIEHLYKAGNILYDYVQELKHKESIKRLIISEITLLNRLCCVKSLRGEPEEFEDIYLDVLEKIEKR